MTQSAPPVLVVDDSDGIRDTLHLLFEDEGYRVQLAANGSEALELLRASSTPRIVLLDWFMPDLTGERVQPGLMASVGSGESIVDMWAVSLQQAAITSAWYR